jgi:hypothetical protein
LSAEITPLGETEVEPKIPPTPTEQTRFGRIAKAGATVSSLALAISAPTFKTEGALANGAESALYPVVQVK